MAARYPQGWGPRTRQAGGWPQLGPARLTKMPRPPSPSVLIYRKIASSQIGGYGVGQSAVSGSGAASVQVGPSGLGTIWYPQQAVLSTTTGVNDSSTAIAYLGPAGAVPANILFQSFSAGSDVQGIAVPLLQPGDFITCVWSGGHPGDVATLRIIGTLQALTPGLYQGYNASMTIPGSGGQVPPRPDQAGAGQPQGVVVGPGSQQVIRAREIFIMGPGAGLWLYDTTGRLIASIVQSAGHDPVDGSPELAGVTAYIYDGSGEQLAVSLSTPVSSSPAVIFENMTSPGALPPAVYGNANSGTGAFNQLTLSSGDDTGAGPVSLVLQAASLGAIIEALGAAAVKFPGAAVSCQSITTTGDASVEGSDLFVGNGTTANVNLNPQMGAIPTTVGLTLAQTQAAIDLLTGEMHNRGMIA